MILKQFFIYVNINEEREREKHFKMSVLIKYITDHFKDSYFLSLMFTEKFMTSVIMKMSNSLPSCDFFKGS